jgi:hypothetical protein
MKEVEKLTVKKVTQMRNKIDNSPLIISIPPKFVEAKTRRTAGTYIPGALFDEPK